MSQLAYTEWYQRHSAAQHFAAYELLVGHDKVRQGIRNGVAPRELWPNSLFLAAYLDRLRTELDAAVETLSVYRSPAYNERVRNASPNSLHLDFLAADIRSLRGTVDHETVYDAAMRLQGECLTLAGHWTPHDTDRPHRQLDGLGVRHESPDAPVTLFEVRGGFSLYSWGVHVDLRGYTATW
jgi:hypothetical protein